MSKANIIERALRASNAFEGEYEPEAHRDAYAAWDSLQETGLTEAGFLRAHQLMMASRTTCEEGEKGIYRYRACWVGDRLMPPAPVVPSLTRRLFDTTDTFSTPAVADTLVKVHPLMDGNGRMARLVMYHLNVARDEPLELMEGAFAQRVQSEFVSWITENYPKCDPVTGEPANPDALKRWPWAKLLFA